MRLQERRDTWGGEWGDRVRETQRETAYLASGSWEIYPGNIQTTARCSLHLRLTQLQYYLTEILSADPLPFLWWLLFSGYCRIFYQTFFLRALTLTYWKERPEQIRQTAWICWPLRAQQEPCRGRGRGVLSCLTFTWTPPSRRLTGDLNKGTCLVERPPALEGWDRKL